MQYSLLSRFKGALFGSLVGEILGSGGCHGLMLGDLSFSLPQGKSDLSAFKLSDWNQIATYGIKSLVTRGRLDVEDLLLHDAQNQKTDLLKNRANSSEAAIATLPIALFFHDNDLKLRQQLQFVSEFWQQEQGCDAVLAVGYAIALALREKIQASASLIPQILNYLGTSQTPIVQQLEQVQTLIEQGATLETTVSQLRHGAQHHGVPPFNPFTSIAIALYCFLTTPEDFRLSLSRAVRSQYQPQTTTALTGAISGAYNSQSGIPIGWRLATNRINIGKERLQLAERLLAVWSGVYDISAVEPFPWTAIAAPRVIRPR